MFVYLHSYILVLSTINTAPGFGSNSSSSGTTARTCFAFWCDQWAVQSIVDYNHFLLIPFICIHRHSSCLNLLYLKVTFCPHPPIYFIVQSSLRITYGRSIHILDGLRAINVQFIETSNRMMARNHKNLDTYGPELANWFHSRSYSCRCTGS